MARWTDLETEAPELAEAGRRLLPEVSFLATVSGGGRPRVHPFCPVITRGSLWAYVIEESPKRRDLDANGRFAIHALPGHEDEQFYLAGRAQRIERGGEADRAVLEVMPYEDADERHLLYEFELERAMHTRWQNFQKPGMRPVHRIWHPGRGIS